MIVAKHCTRAGGGDFREVLMTGAVSGRKLGARRVRCRLFPASPFRFRQSSASIMNSSRASPNSSPARQRGQMKKSNHKMFTNVTIWCAFCAKPKDTCTCIHSPSQIHQSSTPGSRCPVPVPVPVLSGAWGFLQRGSGFQGYSNPARYLIRRGS